MCISVWCRGVEGREYRHALLVDESVLIHHLLLLPHGGCLLLPR